MVKSKIISERNFNLVTCKDSNGKMISIDLDRVEWFKEDVEDMIEIHMFNCQFSIWANVSEETFRKYYINYKKECNK